MCARASALTASSELNKWAALASSGRRGTTVATRIAVRRSAVGSLFPRARPAGPGSRTRGVNAKALRDRRGRGGERADTKAKGADTLPPMLEQVPPDGLVAVVKEDCPTCRLVVPALQRMRDAGVALTVVTQDQPSFPEGVPAVDDRELEISWRLGVEAVPTLYRFEQGVVRSRSVGWNRAEWRDVTGIADLGAESTGGAPRLWIAHHRAGDGRAPARALPARRAALAPRRARRRRGPDRGLLLARLDRRSAGGAADARRACCACSAAPAREAGRGGRDRSARPGAVHGREGGDQRGDGGLPAGVPAGGARRGARRRAPTRFNMHGLLATTDVGGPDGRGQRSDPPRASA